MGVCSGRMVSKALSMSIFFIVVAFGAYLTISLLSKGVMTTEDSFAKLIPDKSCPEDTTVEFYSNRMKFFVSESSIVNELEYAIDLFKEYLSCKNPAYGRTRFNIASIDRYNDEIISCADLAYTNHIIALGRSYDTSTNEEDKAYYKEQKKIYEEEKKAFDAVFPELTLRGQCNYQATGRAQ